MAVNRGLVGAVALAVLVWGVAFGGGITVAVLTSSGTVTVAFGAAEELTPTDELVVPEESPGDGPAAATVPIANGTNETNGMNGTNETNGTNDTEPPGNGTAPPVNETAPPVNETAPPVNETSPPENASADAGDPKTNESAHPGNATAGTAPSLGDSGSEATTGDARRSASAAIRG